jgi:TRAP-type C4-dicarboxylate transport system permease small subunit
MVVRLEDVSATSKYLQWIHTFCMGSSYRLIMIGVMALMVFGVGMALYGYQQAIYPVDSALGYLARAESAQTPEQLADFVRAAKRELPESGNPVWSFPTAKTDFALIQRNLDDMLARAISISSLEPYSTEYNTGLYDIHASLKTMQENLVDATPYLYVSFTNIMLSAVWIAVILALFAIMRRGRAKFQEEYENQ